MSRTLSKSVSDGAGDLIVMRPAGPSRRTQTARRLCHGTILTGDVQPEFPDRRADDALDVFAEHQFALLSGCVRRRG